jgi:hypothetical protein
MSDMPAPDLEFTNEANAKHYHDYVGSGGTPQFRKLRADKWKLTNPTCWKMTPPEGAVMLTTEQQNSFRYKVEKPQPPPVVTVDSRGPNEGYDTFNFETNHPATRR